MGVVMSIPNKIKNFQFSEWFSIRGMTELLANDQMKIMPDSSN